MIKCVPIYFSSYVDCSYFSFPRLFKVSFDMAAIASSAAPRYAPEDPSLPKPWRGLVDGKTGYLYYWNPETNVTQYDRPGGSATIHKSSAGFVNSTVQKSSHGQHRDNDDADRYGRGYRGSSKPSGGEDYQVL